MNYVTASHAGVAGSSLTKKEQKFVPFSFDHDPPPPLSLFNSICYSLSKGFKNGGGQGN